MLKAQLLEKHRFKGKGKDLFKTKAAGSGCGSFDKGLANAGMNRCNRILMRSRLGLQYRFGLLKDYQPDPFVELDGGSRSGRECSDRYEAFSGVLPKAPLSFMDLGCNTGYFVFRLASLGGFGLGIDIGRNEVMVCQTLAYLHRVRNVAFSRLELSPENVATLPTVDVVIFLSLFHHFVRRFGQESAVEMLSGVAKKANRFLVFETGQPDEKSSWAQDLAFMGKDPLAWSEDTLQSLGFDRVHRLGRFSTSVSDVRRYLVMGERMGDRL